MIADRTYFMNPRRPQAIPCTILALLALAVPAHALPDSSDDFRRSQEGRLAACIRHTARGRPWLEKTLWGLRDQEGGWVGAKIVNRDGSHDLGPLQVNSWWVPKLAEITGRPADHVRWWLIHDPCFNIEAARWIFLSGLAATKDYWKAIGLYHSPTAWRQRRYVQSVVRHLTRRFGRDVLGRRES